jgi:hypothetical protein
MTAFEREEYDRLLKTKNDIERKSRNTLKFNTNKIIKFAEGEHNISAEEFKADLCKIIDTLNSTIDILIKLENVNYTYNDIKGLLVTLDIDCIS